MRVKVCIKILYSVNDVLEVTLKGYEVHMWAFSAIKEELLKNPLSKDYKITALSPEDRYGTLVKFGKLKYMTFKDKESTLSFVENKKQELMKKLNLTDSDFITVITTGIK